MVTIDFTNLSDDMCAQCRERYINQGLSALRPFLRALGPHPRPELNPVAREIQEGLTHLVHLEPKPDAETP